MHLTSDPLRVTVTGTAPVADGALRIDDSWPGDIPPLESVGWCGLVRHLRVTNAHGDSLAVTANGPRGWKLAQSSPTTLSFAYEVDYSQLERLGWPAPREAAYRDSANLVLAARSLFASTGASGECRVTFHLPPGWRASTPWPAAKPPNTFVAPSTRDLVENLVVLTRAPREDVVVAGFRVHVHALGTPPALRAQMRPLLESVVSHHVGLLGSPGRSDYVLALLPPLDGGGESYRGSFAASLDSLPDSQSPATLGNLVAHEMFHLWNGWKLVGADYASTQWFQEGFTEYVANLAMARSGRVDADWFRSKLAYHVETARQLTTSLEDIGTRKGRPLYSAGALVAFEWDVRIRQATQGRHDLGGFLRALVRQTNRGARAYAWADMRAALEATAPGDWEAFYLAFVHAKASLPIGPTLAVVGQTLIEAPDGHVIILADTAATPAAKRLWSGLLRSPGN
ncbi:MAG: hypothetical protein IT348_19050 [Candidatus Eisenbacteria bacterium]|nr:hypothetical protein [Candidatus Eisenbacteria bacterium]